MSVMHCSHIAHLAPDDFDGVELVSGVSTPLEVAIAAVFVVTATMTVKKRNEALTHIPLNAFQGCKTIVIT
jgi:hypothetical protein